MSAHFLVTVYGDAQSQTNACDTSPLALESNLYRLGDLRARFGAAFFCPYFPTSLTTLTELVPSSPLPVVASSVGGVAFSQLHPAFIRGST